MANYFTNYFNDATCLVRREVLREAVLFFIAGDFASFAKSDCAFVKRVFAVEASPFAIASFNDLTAVRALAVFILFVIRRVFSCFALFTDDL